MHFIIFVALAGPNKQKGVDPDLNLPEHIEVYQRQALLTGAILSLSLAITQTINWPLFFRFVAIVAAAVMVLIVLNANSNANAQIIYVDDPNDERIKGTVPTIGVHLWLMGSTVVSILISLAIANWPWYYKVSNSRNHFLPLLANFRRRGFLFGPRQRLEASETLTNHTPNGDN
ncbi:hypothetical protein F5B21DRAFT_132362 [Xylaria acuta]|nr:hypothetical protein F5B21DRAFT_132362 [Xylaria acuta]